MAETAQEREGTLLHRIWHSTIPLGVALAAGAILSIGIMSNTVAERTQQRQQRIDATKQFVEKNIGLTKEGKLKNGWAILYAINNKTSYGEKQYDIPAYEAVVIRDKEKKLATAFETDHDDIVDLVILPLKGIEYSITSYKYDETKFKKETVKEILADATTLFKEAKEVTGIVKMMQDSYKPPKYLDNPLQRK